LLSIRPDQARRTPGFFFACHPIAFSPARPRRTKPPRLARNAPFATRTLSRMRFSSAVIAFWKLQEPPRAGARNRARVTRLERSKKCAAGEGLIDIAMNSTCKTPLPPDRT